MSMRATNRTVIAGSFVVLAAMTAAPAFAIPVDKATFEATMKSAIVPAMKVPAGKAVKETTRITQTADGQTLSSTVVRIENPDGSSVTRMRGFPIAMVTRCVTAKKCWDSTDKGKTWSKSTTEYSSSIDLNEPLETGTDAAFDITENRYTVTDPSAGSIAVFTLRRHGYRVVVNVKDPESAATGRLRMTRSYVAPVRVSAPTKASIVK